MPTITCPTCKFANIDSPGECINCGASLQGIRTPEKRMIAKKMVRDLADPSPAGTTSLPEEMVHSTLEPQTQQTSRRVRVPVVAAETPIHVLHEDELQRGVISYQEPALIPAEANENPYTGSMDMQPYYPQPSPFQTRALEEVKEDDLETWKTDRLPWYLPRRRPHIAGKIISIHNEQEFPDYPNVLRALADLMAEFLWIAANQPSHREGERVQVTILRIRTVDGHLKDARLMGYMRGADLTLGDQISFWGWKRRGSLLVRTGYNHTSKATITTNMLSMLLPGLIMLALTCAIFIFSIFHFDFFSMLASFEHLFRH